MIGRKVNSVKQVPLYEVQEILKQRASESDLSYEQNLALEYVNKHCKITKAKGEKLIEELKHIEGLNDQLIIKIVDLLPTDVDVLRLILPKGNSFSEEQLKNIVEIVSKYSK